MKNFDPKKEMVNPELTHLYGVLNAKENLEVVWQCDCHCGLVITHFDADTILWLTYDNDEGNYLLYSSLPEESFRGQSFQFKCLIEIHNYIMESNKAFPEYAINLEISIDSLDVSNLQK